MKVQIKLIVFAFYIIGFKLMSCEVSELMRVKTQAAIKRCETAYYSAKSSRKLIGTKLALCPLLKAKKDTRICLKAFDRAMSALQKQRKTKLDFKLAKTPQKLDEEVSSYLSYCLQGATAISGFAQWVSEGTTGNKAKDKIYLETWFNQEKCGKLICP